MSVIAIAPAPRVRARGRTAVRRASRTRRCRRTRRTDAAACRSSDSATPSLRCLQLGAAQHAPDLERRLVRRRHEHDLASHHVADRTGEVRVVRATEQQRVDLRIPHRREQPFGEHVHLIARRVAPLDELDETRTRRARELDIRRARSRPRAGTRPTRSCRPCRSRRRGRCASRRSARARPVR